MQLKLFDLIKSFGAHRAIAIPELSIADFQTLALIGPSGGGKSTLLRLIAGLEIPDRGSITVNGIPLSFDPDFLLQYRKKVGVVFQSYNLFPHLTALENIVLPLHHVHGIPLGAAQEIALQHLTRFGLAEHAHKKPTQLSGGQQQRVAIVRAVAIQAELLIFDEPTSALDPLMTAGILDLIVELRLSGSKILLASHHMSFVRKTADWVLFVDEGGIQESAPTERFFAHPVSPSARHFLANVLKY